MGRPVQVSSSKFKFQSLQWLAALAGVPVRHWSHHDNGVVYQGFGDTAVGGRIELGVRR
jgi:hypothetical protein